jgi:CDP-6-deoxy-D-xylo-4-hexulose-3-dehydrase
MTMPKQETFVRVPYGLSVHGEEEIQAVVEVLRTSTQMGDKVREFERRIARLFEKNHGVMVNSGSSALLLAAEILALPPGGEVITPALTFSTTVSSLLKKGLTPAFVDVEEGTYCIDPERIEELITPNSRAISVPNLIGNVAPWDRIREISTRHGLIVLEDSADTLGATLNGKATGRYSDISTTSFYGSHVINCAGNGGMLCVNDSEWARQAVLLRSWGRSSSLFIESEQVENRFGISIDGVEYDAKFVFEAQGYNLEPSELGAAFGLVQLEKLERNIEARIRNFQAHLDFFRKYEEWFILPRQTPGSRTGWLAFPLTVREGAPFTRKELQIFLEKRNIQTRVVFTGNVLRQPGFRSIRRRIAAGGYPEADKVTRGGILLGCHHGLTEAMLAHVYESFHELARQPRRMPPQPE